jgi:Tfp pilus assembly major pilin PilA
MSRLREERGQTLIELLTAISIALVVSLATFALVEFVMKRTGEVDQRVDATQRGRMIMDTITRELRSQVCLDAGTPAMARRTGDLTDGNTATFYADLTADTPTQLAAKPGADLHKLAYDATAHTITDTTYRSSWNNTTTPPSIVIAAAPSSTRVIARDVTDAGGPIFRYYAYDTAANPAPSVPLQPAGGGLSVPELGTVARIDINLKVLPTRSASNIANQTFNPNAPGGVVLQDEVYVRAADPNDDAPTPTCA